MAPQVLVTGLSGFIGSQVGQTFLEAGYPVRGTVRSQEKADEYAKLYPQYADKLTFAIVPDIVAPNAFTEAAKGIEIFVHTASPLPAQDASDNENAVLKPALNGTLEALKAAKAAGTVKNFVMTGSSAANVKHAAPADGAGISYTEEDWNPATYEDGVKAADPMTAYVISKTVAEKAAWDFVKNEKPGFTFTTLLPTMVYGPPTNPVSPKKPITGSNSYVALPLIAKWPADQFHNIPPADVRDVAQAHLLAAQNPEKANGQRYIVSSAPIHISEYIPLFKEWYPELAKMGTISEVPEGYKIPPSYGWNGSKITKDLGLKYHDPKVTLKDTADFVVSELQKNGGNGPALFGM